MTNYNIRENSESVLSAALALSAEALKYPERAAPVVAELITATAKLLDAARLYSTPLAMPLTTPIATPMAQTTAQGGAKHRRVNDDGAGVLSSAKAHVASMDAITKARTLATLERGANYGEAYAQTYGVPREEFAGEVKYLLKKQQQ